MTEKLQSLARALRERFPQLKLLENEPMKAHCSFRIGGPAALFAEPGSEEALAALLRFLREAGVRPAVFGNGTNLLVADEGIENLVVHVGDSLATAEFQDQLLRAGAGISLSRLAVLARDRGYSGLEFAHGIPGSLGGAVMMNAGAYGGEIRDVAVSVRYLDPSGTIAETEDPGFSYRRSRFTESEDIILGAALRLTPGDPETIGARMRELSEKRSASQPLDKPSAGSAFKRPEKGYAAAMIDGAGLKGLTVGGAQVSEKHAGFIVNTGNASCADVLRLMERVQEEVERAYGVRLEPEIRLWK